MRWTAFALLLAGCNLDLDTDCFGDADCAADEWCEGGHPAPECGHGCGAPMRGTLGSCRPRRGRGEDCARGTLLMSGPGSCSEGLVCHFGFDPPTCQPPSERGEGCGSDFDCARPPELHCDDSLEPPVCTAW